MDKIFVRNYDKAIEETKNMNEEEIIAYCRKKLKRNYTEKACTRWERILDSLLYRYNKVNSCGFKVGQNVYWKNNLGVVDTNRIDVITNITCDPWNDVRIETLEVTSMNNVKPRRGKAYPSDLVIVC